MSEQNPSGQYIVVEKPEGKSRWEPKGNIVWKGSAEVFSRKSRDVIMRKGIVYASLESPDGNVVKIIPLNIGTYRPNASRPPKQSHFRI